MVSAQRFACCGCTQGLSNSKRLHKKHKPLKLLERDSLSLNIVSIVALYLVLFGFKPSPTRTGAQTLGVAISTVPGKLRITCCSGVGCHLSHAKNTTLVRMCKNLSYPFCLVFFELQDVLFEMFSKLTSSQLYENPMPTYSSTILSCISQAQDPSTSTTPLHTSRAKSNSVPVKLPSSWMSQPCVDANVTCVRPASPVNTLGARWCPSCARPPVS